MVKSLEDTTCNSAHRNLMAYLEGSQSLNWLVGTIKASGVRGIRLAEVFYNLRTYGDPQRYQQAYSASVERGWFESP